MGFFFPAKEQASGCEKETGLGKVPVGVAHEPGPGSNAVSSLGAGTGAHQLQRGEPGVRPIQVLGTSWSAEVGGPGEEPSEGFLPLCGLLAGWPHI